MDDFVAKRLWHGRSLRIAGHCFLCKSLGSRVCIGARGRWAGRSSVRVHDNVSGQARAHDRNCVDDLGGLYSWVRRGHELDCGEVVTSLALERQLVAFDVCEDLPLAVRLESTHGLGRFWHLAGRSLGSASAVLGEARQRLSLVDLLAGALRAIGTVGKELAEAIEVDDY